MKTVFERDCSSKIWWKSHRRVLAWLIQGEIPLSLVSFDLICETLFWIRFQPRSLRKCSRSFLDSNKGRWERRWKVQSRGSKSIRSNAQPNAWWHDVMRARHLEPMSRATLKWVHASARKCDVWGCSVHTSRRLQQIAIGCKRSDYNKIFFFKKSCQKFHSEFLDEWASKTGLPVLWGRSLHELRGHWQSFIYELHQCSFHCHHEVLDEEDDECHLWYW